MSRDSPLQSQRTPHPPVRMLVEEMKQSDHQLLTFFYLTCRISVSVAARLLHVFSTQGISKGKEPNGHRERWVAYLRIGGPSPSLLMAVLAEL